MAIRFTKGVVKKVAAPLKPKKSLYYGEEHILQTNICNYFYARFNYEGIGYTNKNKHILISSLNGVKLSKLQAIKAKKEGMFKGVPDLTLYTKGKVYFIEVKTEEQGSKQSKEQKMFQKQANELGYEYHIIKSVGEFANLLKIIDCGLK